MLEKEMSLLRELDQTAILGGTMPQTTFHGCLIKSNLLTTMTPQDGNECVTASLGYISQSVFGGSNDANYFTNQWESQNPGSNVEEDGVVASPDQLNAFINQNFSTESLNQAGGIFGALNAGDPVFAQISTSESGTYHAVTFVGYDNSNPNNPTLAYIDPAVGNLQTMSLSSFNSQGEVLSTQVITGGGAPQ